MLIAVPNTMLKAITFLLIGFEKDDTVKTKEDGTLKENSLWSNSSSLQPGSQGSCPSLPWSLGYRALVLEPGLGTC